MSGGGGGPIIIHSLIASGQFTAKECEQLQAIADRSPVRLTYKDTVAVTKLVHKKLRSP